MTKYTISTPTVIVNNFAYPIVPNSLKLSEGFGEYTLRGSSVGSGVTETVFSQNTENKKGKISFDLYPTAENIKSAREWKANLATNNIEISGDLNRVLNNAALVPEYEIPLGADTVFTVEFEGDPLV